MILIKYFIIYRGFFKISDFVNVIYIYVWKLKFMYYDIF